MSSISIPSNLLTYSPQPFVNLGIGIGIGTGIDITNVIISSSKRPVDPKLCRVVT